MSNLANSANSSDIAATHVRGAGLVSERFPIGRRLALNRADTPMLTSVVSDYDRDHPVSGEWRSDDTHYLDLSLSGRPTGAWGSFPDAFSDRQPVGKLLLIPARQRYSGQGGIGRQRSISVFFRATVQLEDEPFLLDDMEPVLRSCLRLEANSIVDLVMRIGRETREPGVASELILEGLGLMLLGETARLLHGLRDKRSYKGGLATWRLKLIEERIRTGDEKVTLAELAELCGLSRRHLIRAFQQQTGQTIGSFVQKITIERACQMLADTDVPIKIVSATLGFSSPAAFSAAFRRSSGCTPRQFRAQRAESSRQ